MNKKQNTLSNQNEIRHYERSEVISTLKVPAIADKKAEDTPIVYEAKIITPQPYGIYALCKIMEHLQIN